MIEVRPYDSLGGGQHDWLDTRHHFSFPDYHDPQRMHSGGLRVWNDDEIAPQNGFPPHPHANKAVMTCVGQGAFMHKDSLANRGGTEAGDVHGMSGGSGIRHAECNLEPETTKIFQIWIMPRANGGEPSWGA